VYGSLYRRVRKISQRPQSVALTAFLVYILVRGIAEAEPFDLLLPLWLIAALAFLIENQIYIEHQDRLPLHAGDMLAGQTC